MKNMNLMTPVNSLGYGVAGVNILKSLGKDVAVTCFPIGNVEVTSQEDSDAVQEALSRREAFDINAPCLKIWHEFAMAERIGKGPLFGFPFFEITKFDDNRIHNLNSTNGIIVASKWAARVIADNIKTPIPVHVCPLGVNRGLFNENGHTNTGKCDFLNCGKWEVRKGHDVLLRAFVAAFPTEQDVTLSMLPTNPFLSPREKSEWEVYYRSDPRVKIIDRVNSHAEVANIMKQSTCGVFPSRAEGWNLELLEMMSCGKPVIATNYSAHTEFCNENNSLLIEIDSMETASDGKWFNGNVGEWASLEGSPFDALVSHMRDVYGWWQESGVLVNEEGIRTAVDFSWETTAEKIKEAIYEN
jgi:glycosyltransferase involved in cell wall biosynthesis